MDETDVDQEFREEWEKRQLPDDLSFEEWIEYVFNHPPAEAQWWFNELSDEFPWHWDETADPARTLAHVTRLFESPAFLMERFSRAEIDQGLDFIINHCGSRHMHALGDARLPWEDRRRCIEAMFILFRDLMAPLYGDDLSHILFGKRDPERPTFACYMWWDVIALPCPDDPSEQLLQEDAVLAVMEGQLTLDSLACQESGIHGLGEWYHRSGERTEPIARNYAQRVDIDPRLRAYALKAAVGMIQ